jgi:predicted signal transduction protein with EAL and GGDEF domain
VVGLGRGLGLTVIAEGVEHPAQAAALLAQSCQQGQGYLFSRAMRAASTAEFMGARMQEGEHTGLINDVAQASRFRRRRSARLLAIGCWDLG